MFVYQGSSSSPVLCACDWRGLWYVKTTAISNYFQCIGLKTSLCFLRCRLEAISACDCPFYRIPSTSYPRTRHRPLRISVGFPKSMRVQRYGALDAHPELWWPSIGKDGSRWFWNEDMGPENPKGNPFKPMEKCTCGNLLYPAINCSLKIVEVQDFCAFGFGLYAKPQNAQAAATAPQQSLIPNGLD